MSQSASPLITVRACKFDGALRRSWRAPLLRLEDSLIVLDAMFDEEIRHPLLGTIAPGTVSIEYYWTNRWYNIFRFIEPTGALRSYYCNVNTPPVFDGLTLSYVDLDIDILVSPDLSYTVVDEDEFETNAALFSYTDEIKRRAHEALDALVHLIKTRQFPFNGET